VGQLWIRALRAAVIPLVMAYVVAAVTSLEETRRTGRTAVVCFLTFAALVALAALYSVPLGYLLSSAFSVDPAALDGLRGLVPVAADTASMPPALPSVGGILSQLIPTNIVAAALEEQMLALVLAALVFGLAVTRLEGAARDTLTHLFRGLAQAMMTIVIWILWVMPVGVFCLAFVLARQTGWSAVSAFGFWVFGASALILGFTLLLYPLASFVGRVPVASFARAVAPAQLVAAGARSSLASVPALLEGAEQHLPASRKLQGFVIPLSSASFKLSGPLGSPFQLFILAQLYGVTLDVPTVLVFVTGILLMSFGTPGIPSGGFVVRMPFFVAAGVPIEGFLLTSALDAIPDIFKTMVNVTGDMTALVLVDRFAGGEGHVAPSIASDAIATSGNSA